MSLKKLLAAATAATLCACGGGKKASSAAKNQPERLIFGRGGGVSGAVEEKVFVSSGQYFAIRRFGASKADTLSKRTFDSKTVAPLFEEYRQKLASLKHEQTGNVYKYIEYEKSGAKHRISWTDPGPEAARALYDKALKLIQ
ncbi:MAG: hypothetical protein RMM53_02165 [Bacteroidia bacterium]|nr:hypothetical protein [Bacteroidia bacterium]MDW8333000.1 hypothetical protein [Bacteroidia bacterium]